MKTNVAAGTAAETDRRSELVPPLPSAPSAAAVGPRSAAVGRVIRRLQAGAIARRNLLREAELAAQRKALQAD